VKAAIDDDTRAVFCESIANPGGYITDLRRSPKVADDAGLPLIVDNTSATPYLCRPIEHGATLVVHSMTKFLTGNGTVTGRRVVDSGTFDWSASDKFPSLSEPEPAYHGLKFHETFGPLAFTFHGIAIGPARPRHDDEPAGGALHADGDRDAQPADGAACGKRREDRAWLKTIRRVDYVTYAGLKSSPYHDRVATICPKGAGGALHRGGQGRLRGLCETRGQSRALQPRGQSRRHALADHPLGLHHPPAAHARAAGGRRGRAQRGALSIGIEDADDLIADLDLRVIHSP
jgi:O-acetylhomoserine (thiol)-lyase